MAKTAIVRARIEPEIKEDAERILEECGLSPSEAVELFYLQVILPRGLPLNYNEETRAALMQSEQGRGVLRFESAGAIFEDLGLWLPPMEQAQNTLLRRRYSLALALPLHGPGRSRGVPVRRTACPYLGFWNRERLSLS